MLNNKFATQATTAFPNVEAPAAFDGMKRPPAPNAELFRLRFRRTIMVFVTFALTSAMLLLAWDMLKIGGWNVCKGMILIFLFFNVTWLALTAATGCIGFWQRMSAPYASSSLREAEVDQPTAVTTVIAVCIRLEDMAKVIPPLDRLLRELSQSSGLESRFLLAILSDTPAGFDADQESVAVERLMSAHVPGTVFYRRRESNVGFKAGNLMDFVDSEASRFDFMLVLDADSAMSATTVRRLVRIMQADPGLGIVQPTVNGYGASSTFARVFGFGHRSSVRIWATGQAWWQGPEGPYWGHNALLRIEPFRRHCRLPLLLDGSAILSHDHVEAAMMHAAGWGVRVLVDDTGSAERHPPDLVALLDRDVRWAMGNLQYRYLLLRPDLGRVGRFQMLQAVLHYVLTPLWFGMLPMAALNVVTGGGIDTPRGALLTLLAAGYLSLNLPKLTGYAEDLLSAHGSRWHLIQQMVVELVFSLLVDTAAALDRSIMVLRLALGFKSSWTPQRRDPNGFSWQLATRRFGLHTAVGAVLLLAFAQGGWFDLFVSLPILSGLLLSIPFSVMTSRPDQIASKSTSTF